MDDGLVVTGTRVVLPDGVRAAAIHVAGGRITAVAAPTDVPAGADLLDAGDHVVLPGLVDSHVHVNDPGRSEWEGFETATRAAAAGGTTTIVDMPLNSIPPTITIDALRAKRDAARGRCAVDVVFWGGLVPGNEDHLAPLAAEGVAGFKAFLIDSGVEEFPSVDGALLEDVMPELARLRVPLLVHAELAEPMAGPQAAFAALDPSQRRSYRSYLESRPTESEDAAVRLVSDLAGRTGAAVHVVHLASGPAVGLVRDARSAGAPVSAETCPHYLTIAAEEIPDGATAYKCCPPIRESTHREALWDGLIDGAIGMVVSDHSPSTPELKAIDTGDFGACWGGIASLQLRLPLIWTDARRRGLGFERIAEWLAAAPARLAGVDDRKGAIAPGRDADLVVFDPDSEFEVDPAALEHRHPITPFAGRRLAGRVHTTVLRGQVVFNDGEHRQPKAGRLLERAP